MPPGSERGSTPISEDLLGEFGATLEVPLNRVSAALTTKAMRQMNARTSAGDDPADVARAFLESNDLLRPLNRP